MEQGIQSCSASQRRRASADSQPPGRSRRGSSEMSARLEVELRSRVRSASFGLESPRTPFPPCFTGDITEDLEVQLDDKVTIACTVHGHPKPEVAWHKDGALLLQNSHGIELWSQGSEHRLVIPYVGHEHSGMYCIAAVNYLGHSECHCVLRVLDEPEDSGVESPSHPPRQVQEPEQEVQQAPELLTMFRDRFCRDGDSVVMECHIAAWPEPQIVWTFNGQAIQADDARFLLSSKGQRHRLWLPRATVSESGRICLTAENNSGMASCAALLIVEDPASGKVGWQQNVIRMATRHCNKRPDQPTEAWQTTPNYSLVA